MKKYLLILFCSFAFGQASNQMVTFTQAQSLGFALNAGQSSVNSNECLTKAQALAKYNLNAGSMSAYASNQLVPRSVWAAGGDIVRYDLRSHPCGGFNPIEGSNGIMYDNNYNVFTGQLYYFISFKHKYNNDPPKTVLPHPQLSFYHKKSHLRSQ
jgi:hypothetical protein